MITAIVLAAGKSERMGVGVDKAFLSLVGKPVVAWTLTAFERCPEIDRIVLVVRKDQLAASRAVVKMFGISKVAKIVPGGARRQDSVAAGLAACEPDTRTVVIHDGARPLVKPDLISKVVAAAKRAPAVTVGHPVTDTIKVCDKGAVVSKTLPRERMWSVQTPQAFEFAALRQAYAALGSAAVTDDCAVIEHAGGTVKIVQSMEPNLKITTAEDIQIASALLK